MCCWFARTTRFRDAPSACRSRSVGRPAGPGLCLFRGVSCDKSAFYLLPDVIRIYAPHGQPPNLRVRLTHDHLSAFSSVTLDMRLLCFWYMTTCCASVAIVCFPRPNLL